MKKPSFTEALAGKPAATPPLPEAPPTLEKKGDGRTTTTVRVPTDWLRETKILAAEKGVKLNDLILDGWRHILEINGRVPK